MSQLYYNIFSNSTNAFLGTVAVESNPRRETPPAERARAIACDILGGDGAPGGIRAVMSSEKMFSEYGLNGLSRNSLVGG